MEGYGSIPKQDGQQTAVTHRKRQVNRRLLVIAGVVALVILSYSYKYDFHANVKKDYSNEGDLWSMSMQAPEVLWYRNVVDHFGDSNKSWRQRYFQDDQYFGGPGSPIIIINGGEDVLETLYPFIFVDLAKNLSALTYIVEHRFYGESLPVRSAKNEDLKKLLTITQVLADMVHFITHKRKELGCSSNRSDEHYCPVIAAGGSYSGDLAAMIRLQYPDIVDIGYAGSAPITFYSHHVDSNAYYDKVTDVAEQASPGCAMAVRSTQYLLKERMHDMSVLHAAEMLGICTTTIPPYIENTHILLEEVAMLMATHFADANMDYYPPGPDTSLFKGCQIFQDNELSEFEKVSRFFNQQSECFDMQSELPPGRHGRISAADWTGSGSGQSALVWDFQSCVAAPERGFSAHSMFLPRPWTWERLTDYCRRRFDYTPTRRAILDQVAIDNLTGVEHLLFTNGANDGWSVASIMVPPPNSQIVVINFVNGAHHSELTPRGQDADDIKAGHVAICQLMEKWIDEARNSAS